MVIADRVCRQIGSDPPYGRVPSVANLVYKRVSTDQQSSAQQNLVLDEAGIEGHRGPGRLRGRPGHLQPPPPSPGPEVLRAAHVRAAGPHPASPRCSASCAAPVTSSTRSMSSTATKWRCASTTACSPRWIPPPAPGRRRAAVHCEVHGADPCGHRRTSARPPARADVRRAVRRRGQGQQGSGTAWLATHPGVEVNRGFGDTTWLCTESDPQPFLREQRHLDPPQGGGATPSPCRARPGPGPDDPSGQPSRSARVLA